MAKASGGAGRYRGTRTGGLSINTHPSAREKARAAREADEWYRETRITGGYEADRASLMKAASDSGRTGKIIVRGANGRLQGMAAYEVFKDSVYLGLLGSRGGGAGTAIMEKLYQIALKENKPLELLALERARPFYHKMGMIPVGQSDFQISPLDIRVALKKGL